MCARHAGATVIDLAKPLPRLEEDAFTQAARKGEVVRTSVALTAPPKAAKPASRKRRRSQPDETEEPELVLELQPAEATGAPVRTAYDFSRAFSQAPRQRSGLPAWAYFAAALLLAGLIAIVPLISSPKDAVGTRPGPLPKIQPPPPTLPAVPPEARHDNKRPPAVVDLAGAMAKQEPPVSPQPALPPKTAPVAPMTTPPASTRTKEALEESSTANGTSGNSTPPAITFSIEPEVDTDIGALDIALSARVISSTRAEGVVSWSPIEFDPHATVWAIHGGRLRDYIVMKSHGRSVALSTLMGKLLGTFSAEIVDNEVTARLAIAEEVEITARQAIVNGLVFEIRTSPNAQPMFLPTRTLPPRSEPSVEVGYVQGLQLKRPQVLNYNAPPPISNPGREVPFPAPRVLVRRQAAAEVCGVDETETPLGLSLSIRRNNDDLEITIEDQGFRALNDTAAWTRRERDLPTVAQTLVDIETRWRTAHQHHDAAKAALERAKPHEHATAQKVVRQAQEALNEAKQEYDKHERRIAAFKSWLAELRRMATSLEQAEVWLIDTWGLPIEGVKLSWRSGWAESFLATSQPTDTESQ